MKNYYKTLALFFILGQNIVLAQVPNQGLVACYNFNKPINGDSYVVLDQGPYKNHGLVTGNVKYTEDRFGVPCSALWFDGKTYVTVPNSVSLKKPQQEITITVWFKIAEGADFFKQWLTICCKGNQSNETPNCPQYRMQATAQTISINTEFTREVIPQISYNTWYFYAYTFDGNTVRAYLNDRKFFETPYYGYLSPNDMPLEIGRDIPGYEEYFFGAMDDLRIYYRSLSEKEIIMLYNDRTEEKSISRCFSSHPYSPSPKLSNTNSNDPANVDSILSKSNKYSGLPDSIEGQPVKYQNIIEVKRREVLIYPYDNEKEDGDVVSININGVWVRDQYEIKNKKTNPPANMLIRCILNPGDNNYLISRAWNVGRIPPNTLTIEINDGFSVQKLTINSDVGLSGGIRIICNVP